MRRCACCRQTWPVEFFGIVRMRGRTYRRRRCDACRAGCGASRRRLAVQRTRAWKARLRQNVDEVRASRRSSLTDIAAPDETMAA